MVKTNYLIVVVCFFVLSAGQSWAERRIGPFDEKVILRVGNMWSNQDTSLQLTGDAGLGIGADLEDAFGLEEEDSNILQFTIIGRFKERHRIGLEHYRFDRNSKSELEQNITGENDDGEEVTVKAGATVEAELNIAITDLSYRYSFIADSKHEFSGSVGLFWMGLDFELDLAGEIEREGEDELQTGSTDASAKLSAPLPVFGLHYSYAANSRWLTEVGIQYFTLRTNLIDGALVKISADTRYYFWDRFEVGGGLTVFDLAVTVDSNDLKGRVDWSFWGPQLFLGWRF